MREQTHFHSIHPVTYINRSLIGFVILLLLSLLASVEAFALDERALFREEVDVKSRSISRKERQALVTDALEAVFVRLSGNRSVLNNPAVMKALLDSKQYLLRDSKVSTEDQYLSDSGRYLPVTRLRLDFDPQKVEQVLKMAGQPVWKHYRPKVLVWWAQEDRGARVIVNSESQSKSLSALLMAGKQFGLDFQFPVMDQQEQQWVKPATITGFMLDELTHASQAYGIDHLLVGSGRYDEQSGWHANWQWVFPQGANWQQSRADDVTELFAQITEYVALEMSKRYAVVVDEGAVEQFWLEIGDVATLAGYQKVNDYLVGLPNMDLLRLVGVNQSQLCYHIKVHGDVNQFRRIMSQNRHFSAVGQFDPELWAEVVEANQHNRQEEGGAPSEYAEIGDERLDVATGEALLESETLDWSIADEHMERALETSESAWADSVDDEAETGPLMMECAGERLAYGDQENSNLLRYRWVDVN